MRDAIDYGADRPGQAGLGKVYTPHPGAQARMLEGLDALVAYWGLGHDPGVLVMDRAIPRPWWALYDHDSGRYRLPTERRWWWCAWWLALAGPFFRLLMACGLWHVDEGGHYVRGRPALGADTWTRTWPEDGRTFWRFVFKGDP